MMKLIGVLAGLVAAEPVMAQRDDPALLKSEYERTVASSTRLLDDGYQLTLRRIEKDLTESGDYEGALRAKEMDEALNGGTAAPGVVRPESYTLVPAQARTQGATYDRSKDTVELRKAGAAIFWELLRITPGDYDVTIVYSVGAPELKTRNLVPEVEPCGGTVEWSEPSTLGDAPAPLTKAVATTGSWENFVRAQIGRHTFKGRSATVRLSAQRALLGGLMRLKRVELVRCAPEGGSGDAVDPVRALEELRKSNQTGLAGVIAPVREKFLAKFRKLERDLARGGEAEAAAQVARERVKLFPEPAPPASQ